MPVQGCIHMLEHGCLVSFELSQALRCQHGPGRRDKDLQGSFLRSSWRSSRITWGCQVAIAAYVWAAESTLGIQAPKEDLYSIKSVYGVTLLMLGHQLTRQLCDCGVCWLTVPQTVQGACTCSWHDLPYCRHLNSDGFVCSLNPTICVSPFLSAKINLEWD